MAILRERNGKFVNTATSHGYAINGLKVGGGLFLKFAQGLRGQERTLSPGSGY